MTRGQEKKDDDATLADLPLEEGEVAVPSAFTRENRTMGVLAKSCAPPSRRWRTASATARLKNI